MTEKDLMIQDLRRENAELRARVPKWISVQERLPENDQWALCFMKDKSFGTFRVFQWNYIDWQWNDGDAWFDEKDVTHWMPIPPEPPKEELQ